MLITPLLKLGLKLPPDQLPLVQREVSRLEPLKLSLRLLARLTSPSLCSVTRLLSVTAQGVSNSAALVWVTLPLASVVGVGVRLGTAVVVLVVVLVAVLVAISLTVG